MYSIHLSSGIHSFMPPNNPNELFFHATVIFVLLLKHPLKYAL